MACVTSAYQPEQSLRGPSGHSERLHARNEARASMSLPALRLSWPAWCCARHAPGPLSGGLGSPGSASAVVAKMPDHDARRTLAARAIARPLDLLLSLVS